MKADAKNAASVESATVFPVGSYVLSRYTDRPPPRLHTKWHDPYCVISFRGKTSKAQASPCTPLALACTSILSSALFATAKKGYEDSSRDSHIPVLGTFSITWPPLLRIASTCSHPLREQTIFQPSSSSIIGMSTPLLTANWSSAPTIKSTTDS